MKEEWKPIKGYEGLYEVSNCGRVKSLAKKVGKGKREERILKSYSNKKGYLMIGLCKNSKERGYLVHRLVAEAFIPNPENKPQINHINGCKDCNIISNLEWVNNSENQLHAVKNGLKPTKRVKQYSLEGKYIRTWDSIREIERELGLKHQNVSKCCKKQKWYKTAGGYIWKFEEEVI